MRRGAWIGGSLLAVALGIAAAGLLLEGGARLLTRFASPDSTSPPISVVTADGTTPNAPIDAPNAGDLNSIHVPDPWVWWRVRPNLSRYHVRVLWDESQSFYLTTNLQGFRQPSSPPPDAATRVLVTGDSTAFGVGVDDEEAWPSQLQGLLSERMAKAVEVVNAGVPGHSTLQAIRMAEKYGLEPKPDVLVLCAGFNDSGLVPQGELPDLPRAAKNDAEQQAAQPASELLRLLGRAVEGAQKMVPSAERPRLNADEYRQTLQAAEALFREQGIPVVWVRWPTQSEIDFGQAPSGGYPEVLLSHMGQAEVLGVDLSPTFQNLEPSPFYDFVHVTAAGNRAAAEAIANALVDLMSASL